MAGNTRYKAVIDGEDYIIVGQETKQHMDIVTKLTNTQLQEIKRLSPDTNREQAAILMALNALSDQIKKQEELIVLKKENERLKEENKVLRSEQEMLTEKLDRFEKIELKAKQSLIHSGVEETMVSHVEAQHILNDVAKQKIQGKE